YISTDGFVREGYIDAMKHKIASVLSGKVKNSRLFAFYCKLDDIVDKDMSKALDALMSIDF
ncbi:hypothetical protein IDG68_14875, partial [Staphylococcus sp. EG-SA-21]|uniref:hypothetical protein n=1 Tax=Staphylococcus sp. EG-SA-21 TaxID=2767496 RepID=UPI00197F78D2